jgi:phage gp16-like protein
MDIRFMTSKRIALVRVARDRLGMSDDDYRALLLRVAGVNSSRDLDFPGFDAVMAEFRRLGFRSDWHKDTGGNTAFGMATAPQIALIKRLWREYTAGEGSDAGLRTWLEGKFKVSDVRFADATLARKIIGALRAMVARRNGAAKPPEAA